MNDEIERRRRMRALLDDFLERPISDVAGPLIGHSIRAADAIEPGTGIGPYRVIRELGRGGMGVVFLAEREAETGTPEADGARGLVAIKIVAHQAMDVTSLRRFRDERRILASLEHPGIARLLEDGVTPDGRPWFAMDYVDGIPVDAYATVRQLDLGARLHFFAKICEIVEHAHRQSIVHRDLKPSNILVSLDGEVKLLDFGIAKLTSPTPGDDTQTRTGEGRLTRSYASPEQLLGRRATAASDVFALGVLLFELLTGRRPESSRGWKATLRRLRGSPAGLGSEFPRAINAIVARALRRRPEQRYQTAGEMAADVSAFLNAR